MTRYVAGLLFDEERSHVALIFKKKGPPNIVGKWNAIGGKIEGDEDASDAMFREFKEETGVEVNSWHRFMTLKSYSWEVVFFCAYDTRKLRSVRSVESEPVNVWHLDFLPKTIVPNMTWIIPMALGYDIYEVTEKRSV